MKLNYDQYSSETNGKIKAKGLYVDLKVHGNQKSVMESLKTDEAATQNEIYSHQNCLAVQKTLVTGLAACQTEPILQSQLQNSQALERWPKMQNHSLSKARAANLKKFP